MYTVCINRHYFSMCVQGDDEDRYAVSLAERGALVEVDGTVIAMPAWTDDNTLNVSPPLSTESVSMWIHSLSSPQLTAVIIGRTEMPATHQL